MARWRLLLLLLLVGCSDETARRAPPDPAQRKATEAVRLASQPPTFARHAFDGGEMLVIEMPVGAIGHHIETQRCFVWRDAAYQSASMQCPSEATGDLPALPERGGDPHLQ